jgi:hypothetical protein
MCTVRKVQSPFRQEYEASFENYAGLVYYGFEREKNVAPQTYNPLAGLCWALDFNLNTMSSVICQIEDRTTPADRLMGHRSVRVIKDLEQVTWKEDANANTLGELDKRDPDRTHVSDALGYLVEEEFGMHGFAGFRTDRIF